MRWWITPTERPAWSIAATVSMISLVGGALWVLATDILLYKLITEPRLLARIEGQALSRAVERDDGSKDRAMIGAFVPAGAAVDAR